MLYFFFGQLLSFWQNQRRQFPNISHLSPWIKAFFSAYLTLSDFPPFLIEEKDEKEMPQLYIILYTLFQLQANHLNLIPLAVRVSCMSGLSHKHWIHNTVGTFTTAAAASAVYCVRWELSSLNNLVWDTQLVELGPQMGSYKTEQVHIRLTA